MALGNKTRLKPIRVNRTGKIVLDESKHGWNPQHSQHDEDCRCPPALNKSELKSRIESVLETDSKIRSIWSNIVDSIDRDIEQCIAELEKDAEATRSRVNGLYEQIDELANRIRVLGKAIILEHNQWQRRSKKPYTPSTCTLGLWRDLGERIKVLRQVEMYKMIFKEGDRKDTRGSLTIDTETGQGVAMAASRIKRLSRAQLSWACAANAVKRSRWTKDRGRSANMVQTGSWLACMGSDCTRIKVIKYEQ